MNVKGPKGLSNNRKNAEKNAQSRNVLMKTSKGINLCNKFVASLTYSDNFFPENVCKLKKNQKNYSTF